MRFLPFVLLTSIFAMWMTPAVANAQEGSTSKESTSKILLTNARIFDLDQGKANTETTSILIVGDKIKTIGTSIGTDESAGATLIDVGGRIVLPGLIDLHSHLLLHPYNEATWNDQVLKESLELRTIRGTLAARQTLQAGFTTLRDLGTEGAGYADVAIRDSIKQDLIPGPRIFAVTRALVTSGGYGPTGYDPRWEMPVGAQTADGVPECRKVTREQIAAGADWIKVYADYRRRPGAPSTPTFSQDELNAIVDEATTAGIPVAAHAATDEGIRRSVAAGVKTIEHGYEAAPETLKLMREKGVVLCPTLMASESIARYGGWDPATDPDHPRVATAKALMKNAVASGVTIACGSDVGVFAHGENSRELELMYAYGMPIEDVLRSATVVAASVLQQEELGQIKPGMLADVIVVDLDPTVDLKTLRSPSIVIKNGFLEVDHLFHESATLNSSSASPAGSANEKMIAGSDTKSQMNNQADNQTPSDLNQLLKTGQSGVIAVPNDGQPAPKQEVYGNGETFVFRVDANGSFVVDGVEMPRGDLARLLSQQVENGVRMVKVELEGELTKERIEESVSLKKWLTQLDFQSVLIQSIKE